MSEQHGAERRKTVSELNVWANQGREPALEPDLPIIDTHHHVWDDPHRGRYWMQELASDTGGTGHNLVATVFCESGAMFRADGPEEMKPVGEIEFVNGLAAMSASGAFGKTRHCAGLVGTADVTLGERVQPVLEALIAAGNGRFRGIRYGTAWDGTDSAKPFGRRKTPRYQLKDPMLRKGLARLKPLGLSWDAWMFYPQLPELHDVLRSLPDTNVILGHSGGLLRMPAGTDSEAFRTWRDNIRGLAQFPNLTVKAGGFGMLHCGWEFHKRAIPAPSEELAAAWRPYVETCVEAFGVNRCMVESNFPADLNVCGYGVLWNAMKRITKNYSATEKSALYRDTAARVYRIKI